MKRNTMFAWVLVAACAVGAGCAAGAPQGPGDAHDGARPHGDAFEAAADAVDSATHPTDAADAVNAPDVPHDTGVSTPVSCGPLPGAQYDWVGVTTSPSPIPSESHPDINLLLRTWRPADGQTNGLIRIDHPIDPGAPRFNTMFSPARIPGFAGVEQVQLWDWGCHCFTGYMTSPPVTIAEFVTTPGEVLHAPISGYTIDPSDFGTMVLWATNNTITLKYDTGDNIGVPNGYAIMLEGVCIDPQLVDSYNRAVATTGRHQLPGLHRNQAFGYAAGTSIQMAIRDSGSWMDPRWCTDWWPSCP